MTDFLNRIICGDSLEVLRSMPEQSVDLTVTSPPYDNLRTYNGFEWDFEGIAQELYRVTKDGGVVVWVVDDATINGSKSGSSFKQALFFKDTGFNIHDVMIWNKQSFNAVGALVSRYAPVFEYMFVLSKGKPKTFNPIKDRPNKHAGKKRGGTIREKDGSMKKVSGEGNIIPEKSQRFNVWESPPYRGKKYGHPAMFPEKLAHDHIISWSNPGDTVLDPFSGSGTTAKMAALSGRNYIGIDISEEYCEIARKRVADALQAK